MPMTLLIVAAIKPTIEKIDIDIMGATRLERPFFTRKWTINAAAVLVKRAVTRDSPTKAPRPQPASDSLKPFIATSNPSKKITEIAMLMKKVTTKVVTLAGIITRLYFNSAELLSYGRSPRKFMLGGFQATLLPLILLRRRHKTQSVPEADLGDFRQVFGI